ncbi:MAG: hypothetical protein HYU34_00245 [Candidatus Omnitrophica bacterium]|nr:hypothetical protein [Candidatus Omnitrophota bacterium]
MIPSERRPKRILETLLPFFTLFVLSFTVLSLAIYLVDTRFPNLVNWHPLVWIALIAAFTAGSYPSIDQFYGWLLRRVLFPERSQVPHFLKHLSEEIRATTDLSELANLLVNSLGEVCQFKTVSLSAREPRGERYVVISAHGWNVSDYRKVRLEATSPLVELMKAAQPKSLLREKVIQSLSWQESNQITVHFEALRATCVVPLWVKSKLVGSINLLASSSEQALNEEDLLMLEEFGREVAPSVWKALLIDEIQKINRELQDSRSRILQNAKLTAIEQLATGIAHEIHNPLTIISGKAQVLLLQKDRKIYDEKVEEVLKTVVKQTRRAADITKKLLMFSRASASPREKLKLETVLEDTFSLIAYQMSLEGVEIERLVAQDLPDFFGNTQELREVFLNLILNAVQATGPGGRVQIEITFHKADKVFLLRVRDNGPGISGENLERIFNPFFTTRTDGLGLGLFVTQQIVHRYGGSIRLESEPGEGTLVVIELPLEPEAAPNAVSVIPEKGGKEFHDTASGRR